MFYQLSVIVNSGLQVVKEQFRKYSLAIENNSGMNTFWRINSSLEFLERIRCLKIKSVDIFDFSTLYTNLDLVPVRDSLFKVIDKVFTSLTSAIEDGWRLLFSPLSVCLFVCEQYYGKTPRRISTKLGGGLGMVQGSCH